jgi:hypothetical protein
MSQLPLSIGILAWNSGQTLVDTLTTYFYSGLLGLSDDIKLFFQEFNEDDKAIADHFKIEYIASDTNIGIGKAFIELANQAKHENFLILEHDWKLIENPEVTYHRLRNGIEFLNRGTHTIRLRHRKHPGYPHFSERYMNVDWDYIDPWIGTKSSHLLDCVHWIENPEQKFSDKITKVNFLGEDYFVADSEVSNWTNNPGLFKTKFFHQVLTEFPGEGIDLEKNISYWWARQHFTCAHGEGLFKHEDIAKYGR